MAEMAWILMMSRVLFGANVAGSWMPRCQTGQTDRFSDGPIGQQRPGTTRPAVRRFCMLMESQSQQARGLYCRRALARQHEFCAHEAATGSETVRQDCTVSSAGGFPSAGWRRSGPMSLAGGSGGSTSPDLSKQLLPIAWLDTGTVEPLIDAARSVETL